MMRILVLAAHPDDEVLGMGGTLAVHSDAGDTVRIVVVTDGSSTQYPGDAEIRARKADEAQHAAAELGVTDYLHLDLPDMRLDTLPAMRSAIRSPPICSCSASPISRGWCRYRRRQSSGRSSSTRWRST